MGPAGYPSAASRLATVIQMRHATFMMTPEKATTPSKGASWQVLSLLGRRPTPVGTVSSPPLFRTPADFRHRAFQWNHAARTRVSGRRPTGGSREPWQRPSATPVSLRDVGNPQAIRRVRLEAPLDPIRSRPGL